MRKTLLSSVTLLLVPATALAAPEFTIHTHTNTPIELKSISQNSGIKLASVCFVADENCNNGGFGSTGDDDYTMDTIKQCLNEGFTKLKCNSVQVFEEVCPYNSAYGRGCKCISNLVSCPSGQVGVGDSCNNQFTSCQCDPNLLTCSADQNGSGASCGGKYQTCICKPEFQYTAANCSSPRFVSGTNCGGKYINCNCPVGITNIPYGCEEYYGAPCNSACKKAYLDNCRNRTAVETPYGCSEFWTDCSSKCKTAYKDNCRNRDSVTASFGCKAYWSDCSSKCQSAYKDNCHNLKAANAPYGCETYWSDCSSKCKTAYKDNCRNRTAVDTPYGCKTYFSDCATKCQVALTEPPCSSVPQIGDILYSDKTTCGRLVDGKTPIGIVINAKERVVMGLQTSGIIWSTTNFDIPTVANLTSAEAVRKDSNHKSTSSAYMAYLVNNGKPLVDSLNYYTAASYIKNYNTDGTTKGSWYLPNAAIMKNVCDNLDKVNGGIEALAGIYFYGIEGTPNPPQYRYPAYIVWDSELILLGAEKSSSEAWGYRCRNLSKSPAVLNDIAIVDKTTNTYQQNTMIRVFHDF